MLRSLNDLERYAVSATDGDVGSVVDFLLDDQRWVVRYLVVETGSLFNGHRVLISPISFRQAEWSTHRFHLGLTMDKVKHSPNVDVDKPVSRQHERDFSRYYGYPLYWGGYAGIWGMGAYPSLLATGGWNDTPDEPADQASGDVHLRSAKEVRGYHIHGSDDVIGHIDDCIVDDETWVVRYLVIDTTTWWFGKKVLVASDWVTDVSWQNREVHIALSRHTVKHSPEWDATTAINREYEARLYDYYGRPVYWASADRPVEAQLAYPSVSGDK